MSDGETKSVRVTRRFAFPPETVFDAWLDAESVAQWLFATPDGVMEKVEVIPQVGGRFKICERRGDVLAEHVGIYLEIDRPRRLVFDFVAGGGPPTRVNVEIAPTKEGCQLTLTHEGVWAEYAESTQGGWTMIVDGLARALGEGAV